MDKYDIVLRLVEHPEDYTPEQVDEILADADCRAIYELMCSAASSLHKCNVVTDSEMNREWSSLVRQRARLRWWPGRRAAAMVAVAAGSLVAVALGVGIVLSRGNGGSADAPEADAPTQSVADVPVMTDSVAMEAMEIEFADAPLSEILGEVGRRYGVTVTYEDASKKGLNLYYVLRSDKSLDEIVEELDMFEQLSVSRHGNNITVK